MFLSLEDSAQTSIPLVVPTSTQTATNPTIVPTPTQTATNPTIVPTPTQTATNPTIVPTPTQTATNPTIVPTPTQTWPDDHTAPQISSFDFNPKSINTSAGSQTITFTLGFTDDLSGVYIVSGIFENPSGQQFKDYSYIPVSGDNLDGIYEATGLFPQGSDIGTWHVINLSSRDNAGNSIGYSEQDIKDLGFPTEFTNG